MSPRRVTLLSDFGTADGYAAAMVGVIAAAAPSAHVDHASHSIPPGDVPAAGLALSRYAFLYPPDTVHLVVVDPGVGTARRAIAASIDRRFFVAPDNGVLTRVLRRDAEPRVVHLDEQVVSGGNGVSDTFHGRDLFAPAAGRLARGEPIAALGSPIVDPVLLPLSQPDHTATGIAGEVIQVDRFGNLITNIRWDPAPPAGAAAAIGEGARIVLVDGRRVGPVRRTYGDVESGEVVALVGSLGQLEVSVRDGSAADRLAAGRGTPVTVWDSALEPLPIRPAETSAARREEAKHQVADQDDGPDREEEELEQAHGQAEHRAHQRERDGDAHEDDQSDDEEGQ